MLFNSMSYLVFFPIVFVGYFALPQRIRYIWLLIASYFFYMCWNAEYALLLFASTGVTYVSGLLIQRWKNNKSYCKTWVALSLLINLSILVFFKYANFFSENINLLFAWLGIRQRIGMVDVLLPVGISFYIFQALGYTIDVYRQTIPAEKNFFRYALFVSFFPQLVAGPIERSKNLLTQLKQPSSFDPVKARDGLVIGLWGFFLKIVLADNIAAIINPVFADYQTYYGCEIVACVFLFAVQIYCDFAGYTYIAIGSAKVLGFELMDNFQSPYLARSVAEFWRRWHISLTSWFTDYLYIPLGGNRKGKARKYLNTMIVFLVSGLWHGAQWTYVIWGGLNGLFIVIGEMTRGIRTRIQKKLHFDSQRLSGWLGQSLGTFVLINITWFFFRVPTLEEGVAIAQHIGEYWEFNRLLSPNFFLLQVDPQILWTLSFAILLLVVVDVMKYKGIQLQDFMGRQGCVFRWVVYLGIILIVFFFGAYGTDYEQSQFIYFQF